MSSDAPSPRVRLDLRGSRILVVDDTPANIDVLFEMLDEQGYDVAVATSGQVGLEAARAHRPDLILLDVMMPGMDGFEVCRQVRQDTALADVPVIFLSANTATESIVQGFESGGQDYIGKPFQGAEVLARVYNQLERAKLATSLGELTLRLERRVDSLSVLLIDDQEIVGAAVRQMLADEGDVRFHYEADPATAFERVRQVHPSVILLDMVMPGVSGFDMLQRLRSDPATRDVPVILLTAKDEPEIKSQAFASGASDYLVKLPDRAELVARIRRHASGYINLLRSQQAYADLKESQVAVERSNAFIRQVFGRYLSDDIVESLLDSPESLDMGGALRQVTILMADLRGFTSTSEALPPETTVTLINNYLSAMTDIIVDYGGTIDEFIGDAILAVFGAPILRDDDADRALACAVAMQRAMPQVNAENERLGLPRVEMGIGLNTGECVVGNIGSEKRAKYGIVGRHVNLAARVESYTVGGQILASAQTLEAADADVSVGRRFEVEPKGVRQKLAVFEVTGVGAPFDVHVDAQQDVALRELATPVAVRLRRLDGKDAGGADHVGMIVRADAQIVMLQADVALEVLDDVRLQFDDLADGTEVYAKVTDEAGLGGWRLRMAAVPADVARLLLADGTATG